MPWFAPSTPESLPACNSTIERTEREPMLRALTIAASIALVTPGLPLPRIIATSIMNDRRYPWLPRIRRPPPARPHGPPPVNGTASAAGAMSPIEIAIALRYRGPTSKRQSGRATTSSISPRSAMSCAADLHVIIVCRRARSAWPPPGYQWVRYGPDLCGCRHRRGADVALTFSTIRRPRTCADVAPIRSPVPQRCRCAARLDLGRRRSLNPARDRRSDKRQRSENDDFPHRRRAADHASSARR